MRQLWAEQAVGQHPLLPMVPVGLGAPGQPLPQPLPSPVQAAPGAWDK